MLRANFPSFEDELQRCTGYHIFVNRKSISAEEMVGHPDGDIIIMPSLEGSKSGWIPIVIAVIIIILMWWNPGSWAYAAGTLTTAGTVAAGMAASLMMSGVSMLFAPKLAQMDMNNTKNSKSDLMSGPANITRQGGAVPVGYGEVFVSTIVVDAGLNTVQVPV